MAARRIELKQDGGRSRTHQALSRSSTRRLHGLPSPSSLALSLQLNTLQQAPEQPRAPPPAPSFPLSAPSSPAQRASAQMASHSAYSIAPDSDGEEEDLVATSSAGLLPQPATQSNAKGKGRESLSAPSTGLEGRIGSGGGGVGERTTRSTIGGITTETRCVRALLFSSLSLLRRQARTWCSPSLRRVSRAGTPVPTPSTSLYQRLSFV